MLKRGWDKLGWGGVLVHQDYHRSYIYIHIYIYIYSYINIYPVQFQFP